MKNLTLLSVFLLFLSPVVSAAGSASVDFFAPEGTVKGVRQVTARFSEAMVAFGDPRLEDPFEVNCPEAGTGRWADHRNWVYDFERDLPAGVRCTFRLKEGLKPLSGTPLVGRSEFSFSTGGPAILQSLPHEGSHQLDEEQVFILGLDAPASEVSILGHAYCTADGIQERIGVRLLKGDERRLILDQRKDFIERYFRVLFKGRTGEPIGIATVRERGTRQEQLIKARDGADSSIVVLQCRQRFPSGAEVKLVWGQGIESLSGVPTDADQKLPFKTRPEFRAHFTCRRVNKDADCIPLLPMNLDFTAPVSQAEAARIRMVDLNGKEYRPEMVKAPEGRESFIEGVTFKGPFPELSWFRLEMPEDLKDDAGRALANKRSFPLKVFTDEDPPLAKFAASFGIIELKAGALLPVTLRNIEASLKATQFKLEGQMIPGKTLRMNAATVPQVAGWMRRLREKEVAEYSVGNSIIRGRSIFGPGDGPLKSIEIPKGLSGREFEVVGIPLDRPGFYVVELASARLGKALLGENQPYHVSAGALVTNLAVHFKLGRESSLVWVTRLDDGGPVAGAEVVIADCGGKIYWQGKTDSQGLAPVRQALPATHTLPACLNCCDREYVVTATSGDDGSFAFSGWQEGISSWRFNLPRLEYQGPYVATTVMDRTLLRAGETVHMKHLIREHTGQGFRFVPTDRLEGKVVLRHEGSNDRFEIPVTWDRRGVAESKWEIPREAKQGTYRVYFVDRLEPLHAGSRERPAGEFRVEAFRVPLMKAALLPPKEPLVNAAEASIGVQINYLSGGGASYAPVKLRGLLQPRTPTFPDYPEYVFANGNVKEGIVQDGGEPVAHPGIRGRGRRRGTASPGTRRQRPGLWEPKASPSTRAGAGRTVIRHLPKVETPHEVIAELEYNDPNGEILTASTRLPLWPARVLLSVKPDGWALSKDHFKYQVLALDLSGKPLPGLEIKTDLLQQTTYSHRKRLIGGFYAYESTTEVNRLGDGCAGRTDGHGLLICEMKSPASGNLIVRASAEDDAGNPAYAHQSAWVAGSEDWWFEVKDGDRMDVLPERKRYEPGESARLQVRMPFRKATALVTVEREGVLDSWVMELSGVAPVVEVPA